MEQETNLKRNSGRKARNTEEYTAGPLNINRQTRQAKTIMGTDIVLGENDFEALDLLVLNEGEYLTFQQLYEESWGKSPATDSLDYAFSAISNLVIQINNVGEDFMWIENKPGAGYTFKTRWGQAWNEQREVYDPRRVMAFSITPVKAGAGKRRLSRVSKTTAITGAGALVAAIVLVFGVLYLTGVIRPTATDPLYIEEEHELDDPLTPLSEFEIDEEND